MTILSQPRRSQLDHSRAGMCEACNRQPRHHYVTLSGTRKVSPLCLSCLRVKREQKAGILGLKGSYKEKAPA